MLPRTLLVSGSLLCTACSPVSELPPVSRASAGDEAAITFHTDFDRGSLGEMVRVNRSLYRGTTRHWMKRDGIGDQYYWFYFRAEGTQGKTPTFELGRLTGIYRGNTHEVYTDYTYPVYSYDGSTWDRISDVSYDDETKTFQFSHSFDRDTVWIAYAHPYPWERAEQLARSLQGTRYATVETVARSREQRPIRLITITAPGVPDDAKRVVLIQAVQHAGEDAGGYYAEGVIRYLLSDDPGARQARQGFIYKIIPAMNPDGLYRGTTRYNLGMEDLNSVWMGDSVPEPEVAGVQEWIDRWYAEGNCIDLFLDVHSHSQQIRRNVFVVGEAWLPGLTASLQKRWSVGESTARFQGSVVDYMSGRYRVPSATLELSQSHLDDGDYLEIDDYWRFGRGTVEALSERLGGSREPLCGTPDRKR